MKGMILAAGFGTRMLPVTRFLPKALLPVAGRPLLEWNLLHLAAHGVDEAVVNAHHLAADMQSWAASLAARADARFPRVHLVVEPEILGTGGGIASAARWLDSDPVIVVNADQLFRPDLGAALRTHRQDRLLATLVCVRDPRHAQVRAHGIHATAIEPRPVFGDPDLLTFTGVYLLAREAMEAIVARHRGALGSGTSFLDVVPLFRAWMEERRLGVHLVEDEPFLEAGSPEAYLELLREAARRPDLGRPSSGIPPDPMVLAVHGFGSIEPGASVATDAWIEESVILGGAIVEPGARVVRSILGPGAVACGEVVRRIVAQDESRAIGLLPRDEEEALVRTFSGSEPTLTGPGASFRLLQGDGSTRRIVRAVRGGQSRILVLPAAADTNAGTIYPQRHGPGTPDEAEGFAYIAAHLERLGVPVPQIHALDAESRVLVLEDLGDTHLYDLVRATRTAALSDHRTASLRRAYEDALEILLCMQGAPPEPFDPSRTPNPDYDEAFILRFEAGYFLREMVRGCCRLEPADPAGLDADCGHAAQDALSTAPRVFMHRDYQSRNLMRTPRGLVVIDFQGARLGPPEYDLAALVLDPYADLPESLRLELVDRYLDRATHSSAERAAAQRRFRACGINRMLQALGAFGYLGGRLGKPDFLEHAPAALRRLGELAEGEYPHLEELSRRVHDALGGPG
jgi:N-acetylmuramate 1-kinase